MALGLQASPHLAKFSRGCHSTQERANFPAALRLSSAPPSSTLAPSHGGEGREDGQCAATAAASAPARWPAARGRCRSTPPDLSFLFAPFSLRVPLSLSLVTTLLVHDTMDVNGIVGQLRDLARDPRNRATIVKVSGGRRGS